MISFRFHVVSITAVFLAIAIGVVVGTTYVDGAIVDGLRSRIDVVNKNLDERRAENDRLETELGRAGEYIDASDVFAVTDRLTDVPVLLVATRGIDEGAVEQAAQLVRQAGASTPGIVWLETPWGLEGEEDRTALADIVGGSASDAVEELWAAAWEGVVTQLTAEEPSDVPPIVDAEPAPDLLAPLEAGGFLTVDALDDDTSRLADLAGASPRVLIVTGSRSQPEVAPLIPLVAAAAVDGGLPLVVADVYVDAPEAPERGDELIDALAEELREVIAVIDDADRPDGRVAAVLALDAVADGVVGHYGYGAGADGVLPTWTAP